VLLSGGDPLSLSDDQLGHLLSELGKIPHLNRIRFHTRFPMGIPEGIDDSFIRLLSSCQKQVIFVIHCNHPKEFDDVIFDHLKKIQQLGIPILTQSVLLRGVNDDVLTLKNLFELLIDHGIIPYYLHQLDRVQGAAHFEVAEEEGKLLMNQLNALLPGYAIPKYVREIANQPSKTSLI
jgi:KamA family protein